MSHWYLSKNGKAQGPLEESQIVDLIQQGEIGHLDLVFKVGSTEWVPIAEVSEFNHYLKKAEPATKASELDAEWVLLKKSKSEKGNQFTQLGPFSKDQVLDLIERGEVKFKDFAWKQGLESWVLIGDIKDFQEPLPSTPQIDESLYQTQSEITKIDDEAMSLTSLVEIEHFEHEKTQVMTSADVPINSAGFATETDYETPSVFSKSMPDLDESSDEVTQQDRQTDADLWSLQPPKTVSEIKYSKKDESPKKDSKSQKKQNKAQAKPKAKPKQQKPRVPITETPWPWVAAAGVLVLSVIFLYISLSSNSSEDIAENSQQDAAVEQSYQEPSFSNNVDPQPVSVAEPSVEPAPQPVAEFKPEDDPQLNMGFAQNREITSQKAKPPVAKKKVAKPKVAKKIEKKNDKKVVAKKIQPVAVPSPVSGTAKSRSYYTQRDRKALFYSALRAESLINDLEQKYKKIGKNKSAWKSFYGSWKKKAGSFLPELVEKFPESNNRYAYPQQLASFKKDYQLLGVYGDSYNAKVLGLRRPAGVPKNLKDSFKKHKKQAQSLGL